MMRPVATTAAFALSLSVACAAGPIAINPLSPASYLAIARGTLQEPAIEFTYEIGGGDTPATLTVDLARNYCALVQDRRITTFDFKLRRALVLNDVSHRFTNTSLFAVVDRQFAQTKTRRARHDDPFWVQSELHAMEKRDGVPAMVRRADADGTVHFSYRGAEVASYAPSKTALDSDARKRLSRCLRYFLTLHPKIIDDIAASGYLPQRLSFRLPPSFHQPQAIWTLQSAVAANAVYASRPGEQPVVPDSFGGKPEIADLLPVIESALKGQAKAADGAPAQARQRTKRCGEAIPLLAAALKANPTAAALYVHIGDCYRAGGDSSLAWFFYDIGKSLPDAAAVPEIARIARFEADLAKRHPEFF